MRWPAGTRFGTAKLAEQKLPEQRAMAVPTGIVVVTFNPKQTDITPLLMHPAKYKVFQTKAEEFKSLGHDYRPDTARFVHAAFGLPPVTEDQMQAVERVLRELDRGQRIRSARQAAGRTRTGGASWRRSLRQHRKGEHAPAPRGRSTGRPISCPR